MENNRKRAHRESLATGSVRLPSIKLEETKIMKKNKYSYQDCIDHLKRCRNNIEMEGKAILKRRGLPEYFYKDILRLPYFASMEHGNIEDEFYNFISMMSNMIMESMCDLCRVPELHNTERLLMAQRAKLQNMESKLEKLQKRKNHPNVIYIVWKSKGGEIKLKRK